MNIFVISKKLVDFLPIKPSDVIVIFYLYKLNKLDKQNKLKYCFAIDSNFIRVKSWELIILFGKVKS